MVYRGFWKCFIVKTLKNLFFNTFFSPNFIEILCHNEKHVPRFFICCSQHVLASFGYFKIFFERVPEGAPEY
jgi:hypothetical protein